MACLQEQVQLPFQMEGLNLLKKFKNKVKTFHKAFKGSVGKWTSNQLKPVAMDRYFQNKAIAKRFIFFWSFLRELWPFKDNPRIYLFKNRNKTKENVSEKFKRLMAGAHWSVAEGRTGTHEKKEKHGGEWGRRPGELTGGASRWLRRLGGEGEGVERLGEEPCRP